MEQKKYMYIKRLQTRIVGNFEPGDHIVVQEKIDGANFSIRYDEDRDEVISFSRNNILTFDNNLRGAWQWVQKLNKDKVREVLGTNLILFGEWLVPHKVPYLDDKYKNAYFYDVYNIELETYLDQNKVKEIVSRLDLIYVPVFYDGPFISWKHLNEFVGRTDLGGEYGEGVVVKNITKLGDSRNRVDFYTKIVGEKFLEKARISQADKSKMDERTRLQEIVKTVVTEARVSKLVYKMIDNGIIPENWDETNMSTIARNIGKDVYYDCVKEEPDVVEEVGELFGKLASGIAMSIVRIMLNNKQGGSVSNE